MTTNATAASAASPSLAPRLAWTVALAAVASAAPSPSWRTGAVALAASVAVCAVPRRALGRVALAAALAVALHEGAWRGALVAAGVAIAAGLVLAVSTRSTRGVFETTSLVAAIVGIAIVLVLPGLDGDSRVRGAVAWVACGAGAVAGWRLPIVSDRPRWSSVPLLVVLSLSANELRLARLSHAQAMDAGWLDAAEVARRAGVEAWERDALARAGASPRVPASRRADALLGAYRLGAGEWAWIERVSILRELKRPEAGPEAYRLLLLPPGKETPALFGRDGFAAQLMMQTGRFDAAAELARRWEQMGGGIAAAVLSGRALAAAGRHDEAKSLLARLPVADPDVACALVDLGAPWPEAAVRCSAARSFHRASIAAMRDTERLAVVPATDPTDDEFGGALRVVGTRFSPAPGGARVAVVFEGLARPVVPAHVAPEVAGPGPVSIVPTDVELAPEPGDLAWATFSVKAAAPGEYSADLWVRTPWGPWMRTRKGRFHTDWPLALGKVTVAP